MRQRSRRQTKAAPSERRSARGLRIAILRALFNPRVTDGLLAGAKAELVGLGADPRQLQVIDLPGAFELPVAARAAAASGRFDAIVALGAVIRGETDHYEHVAREAASGLAAVARESGVPVGFGVLTVRREEHALARAGASRDNKGAEAARAAVLTVQALRRARRRPRAPGPLAWAAARRRGSAPSRSCTSGRSAASRSARCWRASGGCAREPPRRARWPSGSRAGRRRAPRRSTPRSPGPRPTGGSSALRPSIARSCAWGPTSSREEGATPAAVVLDEAVELAKRFGEEDSPAFVNGVLDAIRKRVRGEPAREPEGAKQQR